MNVPSKSTRTAADKYHVIVPLWGAKYVEMFVNYSLPSQLSSGNLPALPAGKTTYEIYTTLEDARAIWSSESVKKLRKMMDVSLKTFSDQDVIRDFKVDQHPTRYTQNLRKMTWCYQQALLSCHGIDTAFIFMTPDSVWADGAFRYIHDSQTAGVRALMALGLITVRPMLQSRLDDFADSSRSAIDVSPRQLVTLACDTLHPLGIVCAVRDGSARREHAFYWMRHGRGMVARCFYLHPVMVRPRIHLERMSCTVDYRYVQQACPDLGDVRVITDSDDLFYVDMADLQHVSEAVSLENRSQESIVDWMCQCTDEHHRAYFTQPIVLRENDAGDEDFAGELAESESFASALLERFNDQYQISGRTLVPSNLFHDQECKEAQKQSPESIAPRHPEPSPVACPVEHNPVHLLQRCLRRARRMAALSASIPRRTIRFAYRRILGSLFARLDHIEKVLTQFQSRVETLSRDLHVLHESCIARHGNQVNHSFPPDHLRVHLVRMEYELQREMGLLPSESRDENRRRRSSAVGNHSDVRSLRVVVQ